MERDDGHSCGGKASEEWQECPHCCSKLRVWDEWHGCTIWSGGEPLWGGLFCPVCGQRLGDEERMLGDGSD